MQNSPKNSPNVRDPNTKSRHKQNILDLRHHGKDSDKSKHELLVFVCQPFGLEFGQEKEQRLPRSLMEPRASSAQQEKKDQSTPDLLRLTEQMPASGALAPLARRHLFSHCRFCIRIGF